MTFSNGLLKILAIYGGRFWTKRNESTYTVISRLNVTQSHFSVDFFMDFDNFKVNCSQIGSLMGNAQGNKPPTEKEIKKLFGLLGRDYGELTEPQKFTAREILTKQILYEPGKAPNKILSEIILIYCYEMYGKGKVSRGNDSPQAAEKANMAEPEAIRLVSSRDGIEYEKNEILFENKWLKGIPDVLVRGKKGNIEKIIEIKTSYDLPSFIMAKYKAEAQSNLFEVMGYMDIIGCKNAEIVHCLVDMPEKIVSFEEKRLTERYKWLELEDDVISDRIGRSLNNMEYSGIPQELKIFRRPVTLNKFTMKVVKSRATVSKKWLKQIHETFTKDIVNLLETSEPVSQEDNI